MRHHVARLCLFPHPAVCLIALPKSSPSSVPDACCKHSIIRPRQPVRFMSFSTYVSSHQHPVTSMPSHVPARPATDATAAQPVLNRLCSVHTLAPLFPPADISHPRRGGPCLAMLASFTYIVHHPLPCALSPCFSEESELANATSHGACARRQCASSGTPDL